jgi:hypothetical protein
MPTRAFILAALFALLLPGAVAPAAPETDRKSGETTLQAAGPFDDEKHQIVELKANGVTLKAKLRIDDFFKKKIINANADVNNTNDKAKFFHYYIAFFDAEGNLVGCTGQGSFGKNGLGAGEKESLGSCLIHLDPDDIKKVKTYQAVLYVGDEEIGK